MSDFKLEINDFSGGISDSPREPESRYSTGSLIKHFDIHSDRQKLTPYRSAEADHATSVSATDAKQYDIRDFLLGTDGELYGLGKNASGYPKVLKKTDPTTGNWLASDETTAATAIGEGTAARISGCFIEWQGYLIFFEGTNQITKVLISTGVASAVGTVGSTITSVAQGVIGTDNNLYLFYNNKTVRINSSVAIAADNPLTVLPSNARITTATLWGDYIMIGMALGTSPLTKPIGKSMVYQWDKATTTTYNGVIDWGEGLLRVLGTIEGKVCGVSDKYLTSTLGLARGSMVVRLWAGGDTEVAKELVANQTVTADATAFPNTVTRFPSNVVIKNNKMYWVASVPFALSTATESTFHLGIWSFGRKNSNANYALSLDFIIDSVVDTSNFRINSFGAAGDYFFLNHSADGSIAKTDDSATYSETSVFETQLWNPGGSSILKKLIGVTVDCAYLPSGASFTIKYRKNEETSFTTIASEAVDNVLYHSSIQIESTGVTLPEFRELTLRVESTGGAELTRIYAEADIVQDEIYG